LRQQGALQRRQREPDGVTAKIAGEARPQRLRSDTHIAHKIKRQLLKQCTQEQWASMRAVKRQQNGSPWQLQADNFGECHKQAISIIPAVASVRTLKKRGVRCEARRRHPRQHPRVDGALTKRMRQMRDLGLLEGRLDG